MHRGLKRQEVRHIALLFGALALVVIILWIDIATGVWQEVVILSGLAAGFVTFVLTVVVLNRVLSKANARKWAPVNRVALSEFLHGLADDDLSEISRGTIIPRSFTPPNVNLSDEELRRELHNLREQVVAERRDLAGSLSRWAEILISTGDNQQIMLHIADIALGLDEVRDAALELENAPKDPMLDSDLKHHVENCNSLFKNLVEEIEQQLDALDRKK